MVCKDVAVIGDKKQPLSSLCIFEHRLNWVYFIVDLNYQIYVYNMNTSIFCSFMKSSHAGIDAKNTVCV